MVAVKGGYEMLLALHASTWGIRTQAFSGSSRCSSMFSEMDPELFGERAWLSTMNLLCDTEQTVHPLVSRGPYVKSGLNVV